VTVKLKKADMSTLTRSATLPYATADAGALAATVHRLLLDPREIGPIRLLGVGFSSLSDVLQESLFPELEQQEVELAPNPIPEPAVATGYRLAFTARTHLPIPGARSIAPSSPSLKLGCLRASRRSTISPASPASSNGQNCVRMVDVPMRICVISGSSVRKDWNCSMSAGTTNTIRQPTTTVATIDSASG
jgi:hypothetical protein